MTLTALFFSALASATWLPGGSEAMLAWQVRAGGDPALLVAVATAGNLLGSLVTYAFGRGGRALVARRLQIAEARLHRAEAWLRRWGALALLMAWLPIVGDPICAIAGALRHPLPAFVWWVGLGKAGRYAAVAWLAG